MKVVDIADEIYRELSEPTTISIPAISFWIRSNVGELNNRINTTFKIRETAPDAYEFSGSFTTASNEPQVFNEATGALGDQQIRSTVGAASTDPVIEVASDGSRVRKINKNELSKTYIALKKEEYSELIDLINAYKLRKSSPVQVAGDDTLVGQYSIDYDGYPYNRVAPNYI